MRMHFTIIVLILFIAGCNPTKEIPAKVRPLSHEKKLIITADDFGACANINEGIRIAADLGAITSISAMTNFKGSLDQLKEINTKHPNINIGIHLNITTGKPLLDPRKIPSLVKVNGDFYTIKELLPGLEKVSIQDLREELRAQIEVLADHGIKPGHLTCQHGILSLYSPFFKVIIELAKEFGLPVRTPLTASMRYPDIFPDPQMHAEGRDIAKKFILSSPLHAATFAKYTNPDEIKNNAGLLDRQGILHPDILIDYFYGNPTAENLIYIIEHLPVGISEIVCHVGNSTREEKYPGGLDLDYFKQREYELFTITSSYLKECLRQNQITLISYSDL